LLAAQLDDCTLNEDTLRDHVDVADLEAGEFAEAESAGAA
jgi:hypothetical protein